MTRTLRIGMAQMLVEPGELDANLARAVTMIDDAATAGCDVVVLPECLDLGWTHASAASLATPVPGPTTNVLRDAAREQGLFVAAGITERDGEHVYNSAVLIDGSGEILQKHRKINELDFARSVYSTGSSLGVVDTDLGRIGLDICADNSASSVALGHALGRMGAQILLSPSAWAVPPHHDNAATPYGAEWVEPYRALATGHGMPVIGVSNVGPVVGGEWDGWRCIGASLAVGASGEVLLQGPYGVDAEVLLTVEVPLEA